MREITKGRLLDGLTASFIILVFLCPALAYAAPDPVVEMEYTFSEPMLERVDGEYYSVEMPDTGKYHDAIGLPLLPVKTAKILIPQRRDVKAINVAPGRRVMLDGEFKIEYGRPPSPMGLSVAAASRPDE